MGVAREMDAIFASTGQAVHVAFLVMSQPAMQPAPFRKALIRALESFNLADYQRAWLEQLRGEPSEAVNFGGLTGDEIRAQCVMIMQAVKHLPQAEMWTLQAKFGHVEFEDIPPEDMSGPQVLAALKRSSAEVDTVRERLQRARKDLEAARDQYIQYQGRVAPAAIEASVRERYIAARDDVQDISAELLRVESTQRQLQIIADRENGAVFMDGGTPRLRTEGRRFAFSAERIDAIKGLSDWFRPMFPAVKPMAIDFMLGRLLANHEKMEISFRELADSFGGNHMTYQRASTKMKHHLHQLEQRGLERLEARLVRDGVALSKESD